jgi:hypothetical protein
MSLPALLRTMRTGCPPGQSEETASETLEVHRLGPIGLFCRHQDTPLGLLDTRRKLLDGDIIIKDW